MLSMSNTGEDSFSSPAKMNSKRKSKISQRDPTALFCRQKKNFFPNCTGIYTYKAIRHGWSNLLGKLFVVVAVCLVFLLHFIIFVMINCEWCQHSETIDIYVLYLHHWSEIYSSKLKWNDGRANGGACTKRMKRRDNNNDDNEDEKKKMYEKCFYYDDNSWLFECVSFIPLDGCVEKSYDFLFLFASFPFHQCKHIFTYFKCLFCSASMSIF